MYRLESWSTDNGGPYIAPENQWLCLRGNVYNHPEYNDGRHIHTSAIKSVDGNKITTETGSVYILGEPEKEFVEYCKTRGGHVPTKEVPIKEISNG